ncbi:factor H binding protein domain-containing protein [uncultured Neisseria sp.]|uniref:factor H binding protein domain-containing protein n=1 Tax=uncultured Neisseria sp. TaxID=237778 RepID=UPI0025CBB24C|nr:factor H binding protein domain-containing protein [uncultured Neisseria sp.]
MSLQKISAATIIALSLAACSSGSDSPNSTLPNTNPTVTNPSNGSQTNNGNAAAANNQNNPSSNGNTAANANNPANSGNTAANNPPPRVDFSVSYGGLKTNAIEDIQKLAQKIGGKGTTATLKSYKVTLGTQSSSGSNINLSGYPLKELKLNQNFQETAIANASGNNYTVTRSGKAHIYRQNYSLIAGINPTNTTVRGSGVNESEKLDDTYILIKGQTTQTLPTAGKFNYSGIASDGASQGKLAYSVDFDSRKGSGKITGIGSDINLNEASIGEVSHTNEIDNTVIKGHGIQGSSSRGNYALGFFGPNAEEIVGTVNDTVNDSEIGFAGSR